MSTEGARARRPKAASAKASSRSSKKTSATRGAAHKPPARTTKSATAKLPKSKRNTGTGWSADSEKELRALIKGNTLTRVIGLRLGRSEASVRSKVQKLGLSLMPANRSPYNRMQAKRGA